ncbi:rod shape-determining protein MreC [Marinilabilia salmonicolor]|jgi:rod shape-determining protein MreC|uniref:Cell shape-determining protein MreC n=1 Tax=Marinilabilia salmonicolor TaxID=989 RepID=A0A368VIG5_9BACT|nr:rod shape-determining protein MreC [Marinilabilia salmonicolor]RCW39444.1 rod shape-determining protein MreC [Marinilabilia salmonicolor]
MRNFIRFIIRNHFLLLFLLLEIVSFYFIFNYNQYHRKVYLSSSNQVSGYLYERFSSVIQYFELKKTNEELARENAELRNQLDKNSFYAPMLPEIEVDTVAAQQYRYSAARVINNSVNKHFNYLTLNKGRKDGITPDMGVISSRGLVGVVLNTSENYSTVISVLNTRLRISARLRETGFFGSLNWEGASYRYATLSGIPAHATPLVGDAVVTSGYSSIFPENVLIGTIDKVTIDQGEGFYEIRVLLSVDFKNLEYVHIVEKLEAQERLELEKLSEDD